MIKFNELIIDNDKSLVIDVSLLDLTIDPNKIVSIDHIKVGYGTNSDSDLIEYIDNTVLFQRKDINTYDGEEYLRGFRLVIPLTNAALVEAVGNASEKLIYVYISVDQATVDIPCSVATTAIGFVYDRCLLVNRVLDYIKSLGNMCDNLRNIAHYIIQVKGLELAVETGNFVLANKYWNKFFSKNSALQISNCGCNGR